MGPDGGAEMFQNVIEILSKIGSAPKCDDYQKTSKIIIWYVLDMHVFIVSSFPKHLPKYIKKTIPKQFQNDTFQTIQNQFSAYFLWHSHFARSGCQHLSKIDSN